MATSEMIATMVTQGFAMGFVFNPMTVVAFATLPAQYRGDAAAMQNLARNIGAAIGVSVTSFSLARSTQVSHADIAAGITPFNRLLQQHDTVSQMLNPAVTKGAEVLDMMITRQAQIIAFSNDYRMMSLMVIPPLLLLMFMRRPGAPPR
jgi:DHA2 family multidrug resistance protein